MAAHHEKFTLDQYPLDSIQLALANSISKWGGWRLVSQTSHKILIREDVFQASTVALPTQIEIIIRPLSDTIGVEIHGSHAGFGTTQTAKVKQQVQALLDRFYKELEKIGNPQQQLERLQEAARQAAAKREAAMQEAQEREVERRAAEERAENHRIERHLATLQREEQRRAAEKAEKLAAQQTTSLAVPSAPIIPAAASPSGSSLSDELERLARLHQQGILTDDEFRQAKQRLLGL